MNYISSSTVKAIRKVWMKKYTAMTNQVFLTREMILLMTTLKMKMITLLLLMTIVMLKPVNHLINLFTAFFSREKLNNHALLHCNKFVCF